MDPVPASPRAPADTGRPRRPVDLTALPAVIPEGAFGLLITAVEAEPGSRLSGAWLFDPDWSVREDGEIVATLGTCHAHAPKRGGTHLEAYLVHAGHVLHLGSWCSLGADWPETLRHPAFAAATLHAHLRSAGYPCHAGDSEP
jgi:hypothetical protein